jgi:hypothetical protein
MPDVSTNDKLSTKPADRQADVNFSDLQRRREKLTRPEKLTKADTVALWHAVDSYGYAVRAMPDVDGITPDQIEAERARLLAAKRALRKVNKLRKEGAQLANLRKLERKAKP